MSAVLGMAAAEVLIVPFTDDYTDQVIAGCREMWRESIAHSKLPVDEAKLLQQLKNARTNVDLYFKLAVIGSEVVGGLFGAVTTIYFSGERAARDLAWFVKPSARYSRAAIMLVADWEEWGKSRGATTFMLGQTTGVNPEITRRLYERLGYRVVGVNTIKSVP